MFHASAFKRYIAVALLSLFCGPLFAQSSVLVLNANGNNNNDLNTALSAVFSTVDNHELNDDGTPTLGQLSTYSTVIAYTNSAPGDPEGTGDVLADYVDAGGCAVLSTYALSPAWAITGRIATAGYSPLTVATTGAVSGDLNALVPADPIFAGVNLGTLSYDNNSNFAHPGVDAGATLLADDGEGINMIARNANGNVVAMNLFPTDSGDNNNELYALFVNAAADCAGEGAAASRATFDVTKDFTDDNPTGVEVTISCNTGLPLEQSKVITEAEGVKFVVTDFDSGEMDCEITEEVPAGYEVVYDNIDTQTQNDISCAYEGIPHGSASACEITNIPGPVDVVIHKDWVIEGSIGEDDGISQEFRVTLTCASEIVGGFELNLGGWRDFADRDGEATITFEVIPEFPSTICNVDETVFDSAVEVDSGCGVFEVSAGDGHECTITNTVFFEGIPTLNQYGLALLALLMLGVGFVGFRRLV